MRIVDDDFIGRLSQTTKAEKEEEEDDGDLPVVYLSEALRTLNASLLISAPNAG